MYVAKHHWELATLCWHQHIKRSSAEEILPINATVFTSDLFMFLLLARRDMHVCTASTGKRAGKLFEVKNKSNCLQLTFGCALAAPAAPHSGHSDLQWLWNLHCVVSYTHMQTVWAASSDYNYFTMAQLTHFNTENETVPYLNMAPYTSSSLQGKQQNSLTLMSE